MESKGLVPVVIRMSPELHSAIKAVAVREERSMAQTMRWALAAYVERASHPLMRLDAESGAIEVIEEPAVPARAAAAPAKPLERTDVEPRFK